MISWWIFFSEGKKFRARKSVAAPPTAAALSTFGHCGGQKRRKRLFTQEYRIARQLGSLPKERNWGGGETLTGKVRESRSTREKAAVSDSGYSQIAGDTPATTGVQLMRSDVL